MTTSPETLNITASTLPGMVGYEHSFQKDKCGTSPVPSITHRAKGYMETAWLSMLLTQQQSSLFSRECKKQGAFLRSQQVEQLTTKTTCICTNASLVTFKVEAENREWGYSAGMRQVSWTEGLYWPGERQQLTVGSKHRSWSQTASLCILALPLILAELGHVTKPLRSFGSFISKLGRLTPPSEPQAWPLPSVWRWQKLPPRLSSPSLYDAEPEAAISQEDPRCVRGLCFLKCSVQGFGCPYFNYFIPWSQMNQSKKGHFSPQTREIRWLFHPMAGGFQLSFGRL